MSEPKRKCERCCEMKKTKDNPQEAVCYPDSICMKWLCQDCWNKTHKSKCYLCGAPNCCFIYAGIGQRKPCCSPCR